MAVVPLGSRAVSWGRTMRALIIEDDQKAARLLVKGLREERFSVDIAHSGDEASRARMSHAHGAHDLSPGLKSRIRRL